MMKLSKLWLTVQKLFQCHARDPFAPGISCSKLGPKRTSVGATKKSILTHKMLKWPENLCVFNVLRDGTPKAMSWPLLSMPWKEPAVQICLMQCALFLRNVVWHSSQNFGFFGTINDGTPRSQRTSHRAGLLRGWKLQDLNNSFLREITGTYRGSSLRSRHAHGHITSASIYKKRIIPHEKPSASECGHTVLT